jgi:hypothetical protein
MKSIDKTEKQLCSWANSKRQDKKKGSLTDDKIWKLELIKDWYWDRDNLFDEICEQFDIWVNTNGKIPSTRSKDKTEKQLGHWATNRRIEKKKGSLSDHRIKKLELIKGWYWEKEDPFDEMCEQVDTWVNKNGKIPSMMSKDKTEKQLGNWASDRRKAKKTGKLTDDKIKKLELIKGWYWGSNVIKKISFDEICEQINAWVNTYIRMPSSTSKDIIEKQLGNWASARRQDKKKGSLSDDKINKLELIKGWFWCNDDLFDVVWEQVNTWVNIYNKIPSMMSKDKTEKNLVYGRPKDDKIKRMVD